MSKLKFQKKITLSEERFQELLDKERIADAQSYSMLQVELIRELRSKGKENERLRHKLDRIHFESRE